MQAGFEIGFECSGPALQVRARPEREPDLQTPECLNTAPHMLQSTYIGQFGNRLKFSRQIWMLATPGGLELPAPSLGNLCSILLSYGVTRRSINRENPKAKVLIMAAGVNPGFCAPVVPHETRLGFGNTKSLSLLDFGDPC